MKRIAILLVSILLVLGGVLAVVLGPWGSPVADREGDPATASAPAGPDDGAANVSTVAADGPVANAARQDAGPAPPWLAGDLIGTVVDVNSEPIAGATMWLTLEDRAHAVLPDALDAALEALLAPRLSGADGRFRFERLPARGRCWAHARKSGFAPTTVSAASCQLSPGRTTDLGRIVLFKACRISGRVVAEDGQPLSGARVHSLWDRLDTPVIADDDGYFEITDLKPTRYVLAASRRGFAPERNHLPVSRTLTRGEAWTGVRLVLARGRSLRGRVVDEGGDPVVAADVETQQRTGGVLFANGDVMGGWFQIDEARTDGGGRFLITGPAAADEFHVTVQAAGYETLHRTTRLEAGAEPAELSELVLARSNGPEVHADKLNGVIAGRVLDGNGAGIVGATLELSEPRRDRVSAWCFTTVGGTFRIEDLAAGAYSLTASTVDLAPVRIEHVQVGQGSDELDLEIVLRELAGALSGVVIGLDGAPQTGITLRARHADGLVATGESDAGGAFRIAPLAPGRYSVRVLPAELSGSSQLQGPGSSVAGDPFELEVQITAGVESNLHVDLRDSPYCAVEGTVRIHGEPAPGLEVGGTETDAAGRYRTELLLAGTIRLVLRGDQGTIAWRDLVLSPGTIHAFDLDLDPARLEIRVVAGETGEPDLTAAIDMRATQQDGSGEPIDDFLWSAHSVDGGAVVFERLPAGRYQVEARTSGTVRDDLAPEAAAIDLAPGGSAELVLQRFPFASLRVRLDPPPEDLDDIVVELVRPGGSTLRQDSSDFLPGKAAVVFERLSRGNYRVVVREAADEAELGAAEVTVHPREAGLVVVDLRARTERH